MSQAVNTAAPASLERGDAALLHIPPEAHSLSGFRRWVLSDDFPEKLPVTVLQGQVFVDMSKEEISTHALVKTGVGGVRIPEYWIIDARQEPIFFQILHWRKQGYVAAPARDGWLKSRVFGRRFQIDRTRDRSGTWKYRLSVRDES